MATSNQSNKRHGVVVTEETIMNALNSRGIDEYNPMAMYEAMDQCLRDVLGEKCNPSDASCVLTMICKVITDEMLHPDWSEATEEGESLFFTVLLKAAYAISKDYDIPSVPFIKEIMKMEGSIWTSMDMSTVEAVVKPIYSMPLKALVSLTDDTDSLLLNACQISREEVVADVEEILKEDGIFDKFIYYPSDFAALKEFLIREKIYLSDASIEDHLFTYLEDGVNEREVLSTQVLLEMLESFPEMVKEILTYALYSCVGINYKYKGVQDGDEILFDVLSCIKDYSEYVALPFELKKCMSVLMVSHDAWMNDWLWEDILYTVFYSFDGNTLKEVDDILVNDFGIDQEAVTCYLTKLTMHDLQVIEEQLQEATKEHLFSHVISQLSHPLVYQIVDIQMPALIELTKGMHGRFEWHKEEAESRIL